MGKRLADTLRERILRFEELGYDKSDPMLMQTLKACADHIDLEHHRRIANCKRSVRRDFARYMRSVIADYERGVSMRNRNYAHRLTKLTDEAVGSTTCTNCKQKVGPYDNFCRHCGAKLTATDYEEEK